MELVGDMWSSQSVRMHCKWMDRQMCWRWRDASEVEGCIRGGGMHQRWRDASEVEGCIRGGGMHQRHTEVDGAGGVQVLEVELFVRSCMSGRNASEL
jgi:hypothetical protein